MTSVRFSRDRRGYEHIYLVDESHRPGRSSAGRILYWYRTPPGVKVGREPFDGEVRRTLQAQYPGVRFDWDSIKSTPPPPPDVEPWRERRRIARAFKETRMAEGLAPIEAGESADEIDDEIDGEGSTESTADGERPEGRTEASGATPSVVAAAASPTVEQRSLRRRRRRGGRHRRHGRPAETGPTTSTAGSPTSPTDEVPVAGEGGEGDSDS